MILSYSKILIFRGLRPQMLRTTLRVKDTSTTSYEIYVLVFQTSRVAGNIGVKLFRFVWAILPRDCAPEAHFGADFYPLNLECIIAVVCNSGFQLSASSGLLPARSTHALWTCYVCLLIDFYPLNLERTAVACSSGFPLPASSRLLAARPTHALRCSYSPGVHGLYSKCQPQTNRFIPT